MSRTARNLFTLLSLLTVSSASVAGSQRRDDGAQNLAITVLVYNYAEVPGQTLDRAETEVARILYDVGIETAWRNCNPALTDIHKDVNCIQEVGPTNVIFRILPDIAVTPGVSDENTMGLAFGNLASVSYRWVREEAAAVGVMSSEILAFAAAHEIGHLLLGSESHSQSGIMRARWTHEDFQRAPMGTFTFTTEQAESIRAEVARRAREQAAGEVAAKAAPKWHIVLAPSRRPR